MTPDPANLDQKLKLKGVSRKDAKVAKNIFKSWFDKN
jgi:hypothetical protein